MDILKNYCNGKFMTSNSKDFSEVHNPATGSLIGKTPLSSKAELDECVKAAKISFQTWKKTPVVDRVQPLYQLKSLLEKNSQEIARILTIEHGKTLKEAHGDLLRGIQMVEVACGMPSMLMGESLNQVARGIDSHSHRRPLGVFAGINPFNFPAMVPFWFWPFAVASGNTYILKPSERVPMTQEYIFHLIDQCDFPSGVINMIQGGKDVVNGMLEHPDIQGVSFVGSTPVAKHVYEHGCKHHKRVQALGGAKNFLVLAGDAQIEKSVRAMVDSCYGCAGERCLAGSVLIGVGKNYEKLKAAVIKEAKKVVVGDGLDSKTTMGPVISMAAKERILTDIEQGKKDGAEIIYDGSSTIPTDSDGFFLGPYVMDNVKPGTLLATKEIFGPVIGLMKVDHLSEAIEIINSSNFANTCSIFTNDGGLVQQFTEDVHPSMVGVNLGVPAPMAFFSFGGSKESFFGDIKVHGRSSIEFFTEKHTTMQRWFSHDHVEELNPHWNQK